ncbi:MAG: hypothetical protein PHW54_06715 [Candidatus Omnitrophica bacterium]|nr:hypothetical protein [Candidatus Omnitrophota bacterium]
MEDQPFLFEVIKVLILCASPFIFLQGILLLVIKKEGHIKLEQRLGKEIGGIKKRIAPKLETNIYNFQDWMLGKIFILSMIFIVYPILIFIFLRK